MVFPVPSRVTVIVASVLAWMPLIRIVSVMLDMVSSAFIFVAVVTVCFFPLEFTAVFVTVFNMQPSG